MIEDINVSVVGSVSGDFIIDGKQVSYGPDNPLLIKAQINDNNEVTGLSLEDKNTNTIAVFPKSGIYVNNTFAATLGIVTNIPFKTTVKIAATTSIPGVITTTTIGFVNDLESGESKIQALISSASGAIVGTGASILMGAGIGALLGSSLPVIVVGAVVAGYFGGITNGVVNDSVDKYIFEDQVLIELGQGIKSDSIEVWNGIKEMAGDFKELIDQGVTDIQLKFDDWTGSLLDYISSEENSPHSYLLGGNNFEDIMVFYNSASTAQVIRRDPLVLDLDGDGLEIDPLGSGAHFDLDRNGFAEETAWVNKDDGLLVLDRNGDRLINDGGELFGDQTTLADGTIATSGFEALAEMDTNTDGIISSEDEGFEYLRIWQDANSDGFTDEGELKTLEEAGITTIDLENQVVNKDIAGNNTVVREGIFIKEDGTLGNVGELLFERDTLNTEGNEVRENEEDIREQLLENLEVAFLPDFKGYGTVYSLRYSMLQDETLQSLVKNFSEEKDINTRKELLQDILGIWTDNTEVDSSSRGGNIDGQKLAILESFMGDGFVGINGPNPNSVAASLLNRAYNNLFNTIYYTLLIQEQMSVVGYLMGSEGEEFIGIENYLKGIVDKDVMKGIDFYRELTGAAEVFGWDTMDSYKAMRSSLVEDYNFLVDPKVIHTGTNGDDNLIGDIGNNVIIGGKGDDSLQGGFGNDTYIFNKGDGKDTIYDGFYTKGSQYEERNYSEYSSNYSGGTDSISFGNGITVDAIQVIKDGENLIVGIKEDGVDFEDLTDKIIIEGWFDKKLRVESLKFVDGRVIEVGHLLGLTLGHELESFEGSGNSINLLGTSKHNTIETLEGNDTLDGGKGNDFLSAKEGDDIIIGGEGKDIILGGTGEDKLYGGKGNDTYLFNRGDGRDTIHDFYDDNGGSGNKKNNDKHNSAGNDTLVLGEEISVEDIFIKKEGEDLLIGILEERDKAFDNLSDKILLKEGMNKSTSIENLEVGNVNYSMEKLIQAMAQLPDEGIVDFGKVSKDLEDEKKIGDISNYLYQNSDENE